MIKRAHSRQTGWARTKEIIRHVDSSYKDINLQKNNISPGTCPSDLTEGGINHRGFRWICYLARQFRYISIRRMKTKVPIILASASPRRQELLTDLGITYTVFVREVDEFFPEDIHPRAVAVLISENKAKAYDDMDKQNIIITADTVVTIDGKVFGKPKDSREAEAMLLKLSGKTHSVITGVTIFHKGKFKSISEETLVTFRTIRKADISHYIETYQPFDKAGAYGIQEWIGKVAVSRIDGDYYNVVGLPVGRVYQELQEFEA